MIPIRRAASLTLLCSLACAVAFGADETAPADTASAEQAHVEQVLRSLKWIKGPTSVAVGAIATMNVPEGYVMLEPVETRKFQELMQNPSNDSEYLLAPESLKWFSLLDYSETGYVRDDEKLDADAVLKSITEGTEAANEERKKRGWAAFHVKGWRYPPAYEAKTKRLEWAIDGESNGVMVTNFLTKILGRHGVTSAVLVTSPAELAAATPEFKQALAGYDYKEGHRYAEFREGDKVAEYGLAGLIAGGTIAVAAKTGLLKGLWKFLAMAAAAAAAGLRSFFGKKKETG